MPAIRAWLITPNLPPGDYRFHVDAGNEDGVWNETGAASGRDGAAAILADLVVPRRRSSWACSASSSPWCAIFPRKNCSASCSCTNSSEALEKERSRIARDLHDQLGANLTQVALLGEMAEADKNSPAEVESHAQQISQTARETTRSLDEIVWAVNPSNDTLDGLVNYACKYAQEYLALAGLRYRAEVPRPTAGDRHSAGSPPQRLSRLQGSRQQCRQTRPGNRGPDSIAIAARTTLPWRIEDNGRGLGGLDAKAARTRNGLRNMRKRMEDIHGEFSIGRRRQRRNAWCVLTE